MVCGRKHWALAVTYLTSAAASLAFPVILIKMHFRCFRASTQTLVQRLAKPFNSLQAFSLSVTNLSYLLEF